MNIFIAKVYARTPDSLPLTVYDGAETYFFLSSGTYVPKPSDPEANVLFYPYLLNPGTIEKHMWKPDDQSHHALMSIGYIEVTNADSNPLNNMDYWIRSSTFDGRFCYIYYGDDQAAFSTFTLLYKAIQTGITVTKNTVQINLSDSFSTPWANILNRVTYLGNNSLPDGQEGVADLKGKYKPIVFGNIFNFSPPCVNTSRLIYQVSHLTCSGFTVSINGVAVTGNANAGNLAGLQATAPPPGTWNYSIVSGEGSYFRLGSSPGSGIVTCGQAFDLDPNAGLCTVARTVQRMLNYGLPFDSTTNSSLTTGMESFDSTNSLPHGYYCDIDGVDIGTAVDAVVQGIMANCSFTTVPGGPNAGVFRITQLLDPSALSSVYSFNTSNMILINDAYIEILDKGQFSIPPYMIKIKANHYWTPLTGANVASSLSLATATDLGLEYRTVSSNDPNIWDPVARTGRHPLSKPYETTSQINTTLFGLGNVSLECLRQISVFADAGRAKLYVRFAVSDFTLVTNTLGLGSIVSITYPRYGFENGRSMLITGYYCDYQNHRLELYAWG